jgi:hypothetical protein
MNNSTTRKSILIVMAVLLLAGAAAFGVWYKMYRVAAQPGWITADKRDDFLYGSLGDEGTAGIPYWIWLTLPRIFPEYLPGEGGYAALGFSWEESKEMPAGFAKQTVGYVRVAGNCAICHAYSRSNGPDAAPTVFAAGPGHTAEVQSLLVFYQRCAQDPRFNADNILDEVSTLWRHAQDPAANAAFQQKMRDLESDLKGPEKDQLGKYLTTFR